MNQSEEQLQQQSEVMNRIASSLENLASAATGFLETLARNQETLNNILSHLINK
jgi:ABC-type transporter Mla subunit MlaD